MRKSQLPYEMMMVSVYAFGSIDRSTLMDNDYYTAHRMTAFFAKAEAALKKARRQADLKMSESEIEAYYVRESTRLSINSHFVNSNWRSILYEIASKFKFYGTYPNIHRMQVWEIVTLKRWCLLLKQCYILTKIRS